MSQFYIVYTDDPASDAGSILGTVSVITNDDYTVAKGTRAVYVDTTLKSVVITLADPAGYGVGAVNVVKVSDDANSVTVVVPRLVNTMWPSTWSADGEGRVLVSDGSKWKMAPIGGGAGTTPTQPPPSATPSDWFQADAIGGSDGDPVSLWPNSADANRGASQGTVSKQPTLVLEGGVPAVNFPAYTDSVVFPSIDESPVTIFAVALRHSGAGWASINTILMMTPAYILYVDQSTKAVGFQSTRSIAPGAWETPAGADAEETYNLIDVTYDPGALGNVPVISVNGVAQTLTEVQPPQGTQVSGAGQGYIGNMDAGQAAWNGKIREISVWSGVLSPADIDKERTRLKAKYPDIGLAPPTVPASVTLSPASLNLSVGGATAQIVASVTGTDGKPAQGVVVTFGWTGGTFITVDTGQSTVNQATTDANGQATAVVTGILSGTAAITATALGVTSGVVSVVVTNPAFPAIKWSVSSVGVAVGANVAVGLTVYDVNGNPAADEIVVLSSTNGTVAIGAAADLTTPSVTTDANGEATCYIVGEASGGCLIRAAVSVLGVTSDPLTVEVGALPSGWDLNNSPHAAWMRRAYTDFRTQYVQGGGTSPTSGQALTEETWLSQHMDYIMSGPHIAAYDTVGVKHYPYTLLWLVYSDETSGSGLATAQYADFEAYCAAHSLNVEDGYLHYAAGVVMPNGQTSLGLKALGERYIVVVPNYPPPRWVINFKHTTRINYEKDRYGRIVASRSGAFVDETSTNGMDGVANNLVKTVEYAGSTADQWYADFAALASAIQTSLPAGHNILRLNTSAYINAHTQTMALGSKFIQMEQINNPRLTWWYSTYKPTIRSLMAQGVNLEIVCAYGWADSPAGGGGMYANDPIPLGAKDAGTVREKIMEYCQVLDCFDPAYPDLLVFADNSTEWNTWDVNASYINRWMKLAEYDVGAPLEDTQNVSLGTGVVDPLGQAVRLRTRQFKNALLVYRPIGDYVTKTFDDTAAFVWTFPPSTGVNGQWQRIRTDGTLDAPFSSLGFRPCEGGLFVPAGVSTQPDPNAIARIDIVPATVSTSVGTGVVRLTATAYRADNTLVTGTVTFVWGTDDAAVATVDQTGLVSGIGGGTCRITAAAQGVTGVSVVQVVPTNTPYQFLWESGGILQWETTKTDGMAVTYWVGQDVNSTLLQQPTNNVAPKYRASAINGLAGAVWSEGNTIYYTEADVPSWTRFFTCIPGQTTPGTANLYLLKTPGCVIYVEPGGRLRFETIWSLGSLIWYSAAGAVTFNVPQIIEFSYSGNNADDPVVKINNTVLTMTLLAGKKNATAVRTPESGRAYLGDSGGTGQTILGPICSYIKIASSADQSTERTRLATKYGITLS